MARPKWQREGLGEEFKGNLKADLRRREGESESEPEMAPGRSRRGV